MILTSIGSFNCEFRGGLPSSSGEASSEVWYFQATGLDFGRTKNVDATTHGKCLRDHDVAIVVTVPCGHVLKTWGFSVSAAKLGI